MNSQLDMRDVFNSELMGPFGSVIKEIIIIPVITVLVVVHRLLATVRGALHTFLYLILAIAL